MTSKTAKTTPTEEKKDQPVAKPVSAFDEAVDFVLAEKIEGGYVNDPRDPGGETNFGISKRAFPRVNIKNLTREAAIALYKEHYWDAVGCAALPPVIGIALFDCAVNQGAGIAPKLLQRAASVTADGIIGPITIEAVKEADQDELLTDFLSWRLLRYSNTVNKTTFMRGWSKRVLYLQRFLVQVFEVAA
jgi:lysozyme family protein